MGRWLKRTVTVGCMWHEQCGRRRLYFDLFSTLDALGLSLHICKQTSIREQGRGKSNYTHNSICTGEMNCGMCGGQLTVWPGLVSFSPDLLCRLYQLPHCPLLTAHYHIVFNTTTYSTSVATLKNESIFIRQKFYYGMQVRQFIS